jgi:polyisoprenoid-binding protein YceI
MKSRTSHFLLAASLLFFAVPAYAAETYTLDPNHTAVTWHIDHFGFSHPSGKFMNAEGTLLLDKDHPEKSHLKVTIPISGVDSGVPKLDEVLKSKDFFDAAAYPTAVFESTSITPAGQNMAKVSGNLTIHGVTKPATLNVTLNKLGENMFKAPTAGFAATAALKRSDFGMTTYLPALGDEVTLDIESEANQPQGKEGSKAQ